MGSGPRNGLRSPSLPPGASYPHGAMNGKGPYVEPGMQNGVAGPYSKKQQQHSSIGSADVDGWNKKHNDTQRERKRIREREVQEQE